MADGARTRGGRPAGRAGLPAADRPRMVSRRRPPRRRWRHARGARRTGARVVSVGQGMAAPAADRKFRGFRDGDGQQAHPPPRNAAGRAVYPDRPGGQLHPRTHSVCTTWPGTCGNGCAGQLQEERRVEALGGCCAGRLMGGTTDRPSCKAATATSCRAASGT